MTDDWGLWAYSGLMTGIVYAGAVVWLNGHGRYGRYGLRLILAEALVGLVLVGGLICGLTGLWRLWRPIGLAYLVLGGPMVVAVIIAGIMAREYERGEIDKIAGNTSGDVRDPGVCGGDDSRLPETGDGIDSAAHIPAWVKRNVEDGFKSINGEPGRN